MNIQYLERQDFGKWDDFVSKHHAGTIFHSTKWLENVSNNKVQVAVYLDNDQVQGGMAYVITKKKGTLGLHIPPYTQYSSPLFKNENSKEYSSFIRELTNQLNIGHLDFKLPSSLINVIPYAALGFQSQVNITHTINCDYDSYLLDLNKNKARELKKLLSEKEVGRISILDNYDYKDVLDLMKTTGDRGEFSINEDVFHSIFFKRKQIFLKHVYIESKEHGLISVGVFAYDEKCVYNLVNASLRLNHPIYKTINLLTINEGIQFALNSNLKFDFEGSMIPGVAQFYKLMGGVQTPIFRLQKSPSIRYSIMRAVKQMLNDRK